MKEAKIECLIPEFPIHDLGLALRKGQVEFVEGSRAQASVDLAEAQRIGAVRVRYVERSRMTRKPPPPGVRPPPPPNVRLGRQPRRPVETEPTPEPTASVDLDEVRRVAREEAKAGAREGVLEALESLQARGPALDQATLEAALRAVLPAGVVAAPSRSSAPGRRAEPDEPMFIPQGIVDKESKAELKTTSSEGEAGDMDATAAALASSRAAKGTGGRRKKKQVEE